MVFYTPDTAAGAASGTMAVSPALCCVIAHQWAGSSGPYGMCRLVVPAGCGRCDMQPCEAGRAHGSTCVEALRQLVRARATSVSHAWACCT